MIKFYLTHTTVYSYSKPIVESTNKFYLYPYNDIKQQLVSHKLTISGNPAIYSYYDNFNNRVGFFTYNPPHDTLLIKSEAEIVLNKSPLPELDIDIKTQWSSNDEIGKDLAFMPFTLVSDFNAKKELETIVKSVRVNRDSVLSLAQKLCQYVYENMTYKKGVTNVFTTLDQVWELKSGVCQDFTNLYIQLCRIANIPTRYVSGYVYANQGILGAGATHAWAEVYIPSYGWLGLDPTNNCIADMDHIRLAIGRGYEDCTPVKGVFKGNEKQKMSVSVYLDTVKQKTMEMKISEEIPEEIPDNNTVESDPVKNSYRKQLEIIQQQQ
jgi:transglutaminase-like putative cysteine protease